MTDERRKQLIDSILQAIAAGGGYITGELFFTLAFRTEGELLEICSELHIRG